MLDARRRVRVAGGDPGSWVEPQPLPEGWDESA